MATERKTTVRRTPAPRNEATQKLVEEKRKFADDEKILCRSITPGEYLYVGEKSKTLYSWPDANETAWMRYDDLTTAIRMRKPCVTKPRVIIENEDVLREYPEIQKIYDSMYSKDDLTQILRLDATQMINIIKQLPDGAKDAIKGMALRAIEDGTLDSVARVRALDQFFGTDMLLKLAQ